MSDYGHTCALKDLVGTDRAHVEYMLTRLDTFVKSGGKTGLGSFLSALVLGDLAEAVGCADDVNIRHLRRYVQYIYCHLPTTYVNIGGVLFRQLRRLISETGLPISQRMVAEALDAFMPRMRQLMAEGTGTTCAR